MRSGHAQLKRQELFQRKLCTCFGDPSACWKARAAASACTGASSCARRRCRAAGSARKGEGEVGKLGGSSSVPAKLPPLAGGATAGATGAPCRARADDALVDLQRLAAATHKAETPVPPSAAERAADKTVHEDDELRILQLADMVLAQSAWRGVAWRRLACARRRSAARRRGSWSPWHKPSRRVRRGDARRAAGSADAAVREEACRADVRLLATRAGLPRAHARAAREERGRARAATRPRRPPSAPQVRAIARPSSRVRAQRGTLLTRAQ